MSVMFTILAIVVGLVILGFLGTGVFIAWAYTDRCPKPWPWILRGLIIWIVAWPLICLGVHHLWSSKAAVAMSMPWFIVIKVLLLALALMGGCCFTVVIWNEYRPAFTTNDGRPFFGRIYLVFVIVVALFFIVRRRFYP